MAASDIAHRDAGLHGLGDDGHLLLGREAAATRDARDDLNLGKRLGHRRMPRTIPRPSG